MGRSKIAWTDASWNPVTGCDRVSPGCAHCYARSMANRLKAMGQPVYQRDGGKASGPGFGVTLHPERLGEPLRWKKPCKVFVCSMGDLFHEEVPFEFIAEVWDAMFNCGGVEGYEPQHIFQILTKRPKRMLDFAEWMNKSENRRIDYRNVWLGVSVENQRMADQRIPLLMQTPAVKRFVSAEPLLGELDLTDWLDTDPRHGRFGCYLDGQEGLSRYIMPTSLDWVIVGGESGGPEDRRLVERIECSNYDRLGGTRNWTEWQPKFGRSQWVRTIRDQCQEAHVPFLFKGWGGPRPKSGGCMLDGEEWKEMPE